MNFKKLRVHGFKSFVDPVELVIEPGITGVVGPNGCGKSNVIESLRWVMGEASAKRMRGGEMDDVIFGGSAGRPQRNNAEVTLTLDNQERLAPAAFNDSDELEITRRIDRGQGSTYRINGKEVRARDVQLFFADMATGANSTAIVSQGRVGALIGAKPTDRRTLLEEAAGIRGLHSRRHEAELRLKAAESNLERLEDVIGALESQLGGLQRQARQANRYRKIAEQHRAQEAILLHLRWSAAQESLDAARARLTEAEALVAERTRGTAQGTALQSQAHDILPKLREAEAEAAARLQAHILSEGQLEAEAERVAGQLEDLVRRLDQIAADIIREETLATDAAEALERLTTEQEGLSSQGGGESEALAALQAECERLDAAVAEREETLDEMNQHVAAVEAQRGTLSRQVDEARQRLAALQQRETEIAAENAGLSEAIAGAGDIDAARAEVTAAETALTAARETLETAEAARAEADRAAAAAREALSEADSQRREALDKARNAARDAVSAAERIARESLSQSEQTARTKIAETENAGRAAVEAESRRVADLSAEAKALHDLLDQDEDDADPVLEKLTVDGGFETALGAAFGDDLDAALDDDAARQWRDLGGLPSGSPVLPAGTKPLSEFVMAPPALARRLSQVGLVDSAEDATALQASLAVGQRLVSRDGGLWRWDGLRIRPGTATAAAKRLEQRNRLTVVETELADAKTALERATETARTALDAVKAEQEAAVAKTKDAGAAAIEAATREGEAAVTAAENAATDRLDTLRRDAETAARTASEKTEAAQAARRAQQDAFDRAGAARTALSGLEQKVSDSRTRLATLVEESRRVEEEKTDAAGRIEGSEQALSVLEDTNALRERLSRARTELAELRAEQVEKRATRDRFERDAKSRKERLNAISAEQQSWQARADGATRRMKDLKDRQFEAVKEKDALAERPQAIAEQRALLRDQIAALEAERQAAADRLVEAETAMRDTDHALKLAEQALAEARETRVRREAEVEQAMQAVATVAERIREKLECAPEETLAQSGLEPDAALPDLDDVERRLERLARERDSIGPVNLRAEQEAQELEEQIASMKSERDDLVAAIGRLRQGINALNREGRERLLKAFDEVDAHFRELFVTLFGGGEAHLKLTESDDPLQAGLEIMASPPGKKMQILSLLSGGEQALTALALLFGVFLTNPAPICVLDEVDAPLDDTNVDRFCQMLDQITKAGSTRFLVVTHHRMTMARMDRLFGVTMAERGVSQLVSVDLRQAERMREAG
ncbi:AAA family ATPase [Rhodospirillaceae bacterium KN72]|uniref:Chromosome partition protein Smc n=1 Tax=Pacificispira spongiicola TaxID=2729598 RepID=A0A7Y0DX47_9PROT|nr:AAA family ATPase [Pacificispira spongiicola]NMM43225.1 AAA family ATPase [Pacificispira spongiicola]